MSAGVTRFRRAVVVSDVDPPAAPCGACRQVLAEFGLDLPIDGVGTQGHCALAPLRSSPSRIRPGAASVKWRIRGVVGSGCYCRRLSGEADGAGRLSRALSRRPARGIRRGLYRHQRAPTAAYVGYVQPHQAAALLVSNGLQGFEERGLVRFLARGGLGDRPGHRSAPTPSIRWRSASRVAARDTNLDRSPAPAVPAATVVRLRQHLRRRCSRLRSRESHRHDRRARHRSTRVWYGRSFRVPISAGCRSAGR